MMCMYLLKALTGGGEGKGKGREGKGMGREGEGLSERVWRKRGELEGRKRN